VDVTQTTSPTSDSTTSVPESEPILPPILQSCVVCAEEFEEPKVSIRTAGSCSHRTKTCGDCFSSWVASQIETVGWDQIRCPECPRLLSYDDIKSATTEEVFQK
jgi:hypothetical protein